MFNRDRRALEKLFFYETRYPDYILTCRYIANKDLTCKDGPFLYPQVPILSQIFLLLYQIFFLLYFIMLVPLVIFGRARRAPMSGQRRTVIGQEELKKNGLGSGRKGPIGEALVDIDTQLIKDEQNLYKRFR